MTIRNLSRNKILADNIEKADTPPKRMKGLLGRSGLAAGEGLLISPCQSVHMLFMKFPIDVVFLDRAGLVVGLCVNLQPFQFSPVFWKSACALELAAGTIQSTGTQTGDQTDYGRHV